MARTKKSTVFEDDETPEEEIGSEMPTGADGTIESAANSLSDDDLIGESESREPEQADELREEVNAKGSVGSDVKAVAETVIPDGWQSMEHVPLVGIRVVLADSEDNYVKAFWKKTRRFLNHRWQMSGKWCDAATGKDLDFNPVCWRDLRAGE